MGECRADGDEGKHHPRQHELSVRNPVGLRTYQQISNVGRRVKFQWPQRQLNMFSQFTIALKNLATVMAFVQFGLFIFVDAQLSEEVLPSYQTNRGINFLEEPWEFEVRPGLLINHGGRIQAFANLITVPASPPPIPSTGRGPGRSQSPPPFRSWKSQPDERQSVEELHDLRVFIKFSLRRVSIFHLRVAPGFAGSVRVEWRLCGGDLNSTSHVGPIRDGCTLVNH